MNAIINEVSIESAARIQSALTGTQFSSTLEVSRPVDDNGDILFGSVAATIENGKLYADYSDDRFAVTAFDALYMTITSEGT